jgi:cytoskeletal protein CcmA (bactofilin family)
MALIRKDEVPNPGAQAPKSGQTHTILGPESSFEGKLTFSGSVRIDGSFQGEIVTDDQLTVGESAEITAQVNVGHLHLNGTLRGNVKAKKSVVLQMPGRMYGDIETPSLIIHQGVVFEGCCKMEKLSEKGNAAPLKLKEKETPKGS